jgi:hypothetical protein
MHKLLHGEVLPFIEVHHPMVRTLSLRGAKCNARTRLEPRLAIVAAGRAWLKVLVKRHPAPSTPTNNARRPHRCIQKEIHIPDRLQTRRIIESAIGRWHDCQTLILFCVRYRGSCQRPSASFGRHLFRAATSSKLDTRLQCCVFRL